MLTPNLSGSTITQTIHKHRLWGAGWVHAAGNKPQMVAGRDHINVLKLKAAYLAFKAFVKDCQHYIVPPHG